MIDGIIGFSLVLIVPWTFALSLNLIGKPEEWIEVWQYHFTESK